ncbi:MAG: GGDEF domain-containing protein [Clostridia bacterium]|nr:GGDEF domain-containing protein [Clostridia bacterium]
MKENGKTEISKEEYQKLYDLAYHDNLTGCHNRNWFLENFSDKDEFKFILVDINNLKIENDTKGHFAGDKLIKEVADSLKQFGEVVRCGGDEFILITPKEFDVKVINSKKYCYGWFDKDKTNTLKEVLELADYCLNMRKKSIKGLLKKGYSERKVELKKLKIKNYDGFK